MDCGAAGAGAAAGEEGGFLVGACAQAEEPALATKMIEPKKVDRIRKRMRLAESPRIEDTARRVSGTNGYWREQCVGFRKRAWSL